MEKEVKEQITVSAGVSTSEKAKELLDDLEVLKDKYTVVVSLNISPIYDLTC